MQKAYPNWINELLPVNLTDIVLGKQLGTIYKGSKKE